ncbi:HET-domain-containing protein [Trematosphaeria pertusa]|uniref:HET-domain-containing protein n=1 Tax=Trematosphaeria pertusa TaxID=390896 RepID=A0A6A6IGQ8_9PLEO|nr:HET-domain-containing protein [Trematosphaeria pertusa]KAF2249596.1 HET-domain-containing protein [Trematosphaeria pertusa]
MDLVQCVDNIDDLSRHGFTLNDDGTLQPAFDEKGRICNPDLVLRPNLLCSRCIEIARRLLSRSCDAPPFCGEPFYDSERELRQSVMQGCHLCALFWGQGASISDGQEKFGTANTVELPSGSWVSQYQNRRSSLLQYLRYTGRALSTHNSSLAILRGDGLRYAAHQDLNAKFNASNASTETFSVALSWLNECLYEHRKCRDIHHAIAKPPTRLLDIGISDPIVRLVYPTAPVRYVTVSHRWGSSRPLTLTRANEARLSEGFSFEELPQLFRDCVMVARRLGLRHIWIDSLCILQDSTEDWAYESGRMGYVYRGSLLNIAAVSARDSSDSLFTRRHPLCTNSCYLQEVSTRARNIVRISASRKTAPSLYNRAWVLQERLLPARTLEYTHEGVNWYCTEALYEGPSQHQDAKPEWVHATGPWGSPSLPWNFLLDMKGTELSPPLRETGQRYWMEIINAYTAMDLTYETDRPYALQGIIATLQQQTHLRFVAGVCKDFLPYSLLWCIPGRRSVRKASCFAYPSWSCAYRRSKRRFALEWLEERKLSTGASTCADVSICDQTLFLHLKGRSFGPVMILPQRGGQGYDEFGSEVVAYITASSRYTWCPRVQLNESFSKLRGVLQLITDYDISNALEVDLVILASGMWLGEFGGLILTRAELDTDTWERVGMFTIDRSDIERLEKGKRSWFDVAREYQVR